MPATTPTVCLVDGISDLMATSSSVSPEGEEVRAEYYNGVEHYFEPILSGITTKNLQKELWDGYNHFLANEKLEANEFDQITQAYFNAGEFINTFPPQIVEPEISFDLEFGVIFDWTASRFRNFSVSVNHSPLLSWAGISNKSIQHGKEVLDEKFPEDFIKWLKRVYQRSYI